ncbi:MAG TPA: lysophospholipid acyltransferase family protein [Stellaceae bacterium]|nr:lysophospholipid acyltransferase family protein [Stellaceae bacterium]
MILLRSFAFQLVFWLWTAFLGLAALPLLLLPRRMVMAFGTFWSKGTLALLRLVAGLDFELRGIENLPAGAVIVAMKHQSAWDTFAAPVLFRDPAVVIKRELGWLPFYGWYALKAGSIAIDRAGRAGAVKRLIRAAEKAKAEGRPIVIFPEGTRSAVGERRPYLPGVAALYQFLGLPLVPVAVNSGLFWKRRSLIRRPGKVLVEILPAIPPGLDRHLVIEMLQSRIEDATAALVGESRRSAP